QWKGILIEPQPKPFKILSYIYRKKNVKLLNVAIDNKSKSRRLYKIAVSNSRWASGLSSFDEVKIKGLINSKRVIRKSKNEGVKMPLNPETFVAFDEVKCVSFDDLIAKNTIKKIDLLQIDTEGYDFELLKQFPFETLKPNVIIFENIHLSTEDCKNAESLLEKQAYQLKDFGSDTLAKLIG
ncbi:MAG: FkbM family methyltransferase, partial [Bacteroidetes bacterium]|nr:FkbM family methyltransferase [Bacteroidota bacterium]